jgi:hypothetical protein
MDTSDLGAEWLEQLCVRAQVSGLNPSTAQGVDFRAKITWLVGPFQDLKKIAIFDSILEFQKILITTGW